MTVTLTHGGDWAGFAAEYGAKAPLLDASANVSPLGLPEGVRAAVRFGPSDGTGIPAGDVVE